MAAIINIAAYAVLGIPSIIFGVILIKHKPSLKWPAWFLLLNGLACIAGIIGAAADVQWLAFGCFLGGILYLISLIGFIIGLSKRLTALP